MAEFACASEIRKGMADPISATPSSIRFRRLPNLFPHIQRLALVRLVGPTRPHRSQSGEGA
jgi:hypothetical protein